MLTFALKETIPLNSLPCEEEEPQLGISPLYTAAYYMTARRFLRMLQRRYGTLPKGMSFKIVTRQTDLGEFDEVTLIHNKDEVSRIFANIIFETRPCVWSDTDLINLYDEFRKYRSEYCPACGQSQQYYNVKAKQSLCRACTAR